MLAARPHFEPRLVSTADSVRVTEIFLSIQGESTLAGLPCSFIRLTGCHLRCSYCDTEYAFKGGARLKNSDVVRQVMALGAPLVEVTGGEPLLQPGVYPLMQSLLDAGLTVMLETSGSIDVRLVPRAVHKIVDLKTPSSGECDRNDYRVLDSMNGNDELKLVIGTREDYEWARGLFRDGKLKDRPYPVLVSTVFGKLPPLSLVQWVLEDKLKVRFQLQMHKYIWHPDARGI